MSAIKNFATLALADDFASRLLAKHLAQADALIVEQAEAQGLIDKGYFSTMLNEGKVEGDFCFQDGCNGVLEDEKDPESGGCSCHLGGAPCSHYTSGYYVCNQCGRGERYSY